MDKNDEIGVFNPLSKDFSCRYDTSGKGQSEKLTVPSREIVYLSPEIAKHVKKHLYNAIVNDRDLNGITLNANLKLKRALLDEMEVKDEETS